MWKILTAQKKEENYYSLAGDNFWKNKKNISGEQVK